MGTKRLHLALAQDAQERGQRTLSDAALAGEESDLQASSLRGGDLAPRMLNFLEPTNEGFPRAPAGPA